MNEKFFYSMFNIFNHENEVAISPEGKRVKFMLDNVWKVTDLSTNEATTFYDINGVCSWLNRNDFKPERRQ